MRKTKTVSRWVTAGVVIVLFHCQGNKHPAQQNVQLQSPLPSEDHNNVQVHVSDSPQQHDACTGVVNTLGVRLLPGFCLRTIATGLLNPRGMAVTPEGHILVAESGPGWRHRRGRLSLLELHNGQYQHRVVLEHLDRPHGLALANRYLYIGESNRISRVRYPLTTHPRAETVVDNLPTNGRHNRRTVFLGDRDTLYFSMGSRTDNCEAHPHGLQPEDPCTEAEGLPPLMVNTTVDAGVQTPDAQVTPSEFLTRGAIYRLQLGTRHRPTVYAVGLRNTLGLAWHPTGKLWGIENSRDYIHRIDSHLSDEELPHDELNEIVEHGNYGWPYCFDAQRPSPEYANRGRFCRESTRAPVLLPPHSAPIGIVFYHGNLFPETYRTRAFIAYHGYRQAGHRIVSLQFDSEGMPIGNPEDFVSGWEERPGRPHGQLSGLATARDGSLLVSDDHNGAIYAISYGESALHTTTVQVPVTPAVAPDTTALCQRLSNLRTPFAEVERTVIDRTCIVCHAGAAGGLTLRMCDDQANLTALTQGHSAAYGPYVIPGDTTQGYLLARLRGDSMGPQMPPPGVAMAPNAVALIEAWIRALPR